MGTLNKDQLVALAKGLRPPAAPVSRLSALVKVFDLRKINKLLKPMKAQRGRWFVLRAQYTVVRLRLLDWWRAGR